MYTRVSRAVELDALYIAVSKFQYYSRESPIPSVRGKRIVVYMIL